MTKVFISYSHADEGYRIQLEKHLSVLKRNGYIDTWTDREIIVGENWGNEIAKELEEAKIILLLVSADFLASNYCYDIEMKSAIDRHAANEAIVVPILLRYCDWSNTPFSSIQALPLNARPVKDWPDQDQAFLSIVEGIKALLNTLETSNQKGSTYGLILSPEEQLGEIRRKLLTSHKERDLRMVKFELDNYKKIYPPTFEVQELERQINDAIELESLSKELVTYGSPPMERGRGIWWPIFVLAFIAGCGILYLAIKLLINYLVK